MKEDSSSPLVILVQNIDSEIEKIKKSYTKELIERLYLESMVSKSYSPFVSMGKYLTEELNKLLTVENLESVFGRIIFENFTSNDTLALERIKAIVIILNGKIKSFLNWSNKNNLRIYEPCLDYFINKHRLIFDNINLVKIDAETKILNTPFRYNEHNLNDDIRRINFHYAEEILSFYSPIGMGRINESELLTMFKERHRFTLYELLDIEENHHYFHKHYLKGLKLLIQFGVLEFNKSNNDYELTVYGQHLINCTIHYNENESDFNPKKIFINPKIGKDLNIKINRLLAVNFNIKTAEKVVDYCSILEDFFCCCSSTEMKVGHKYASYKTGLPNLSTSIRKFRSRF